MSELTDRIDDAFTRPVPEDAIRLVKEAVHAELRGLDAGLGVEQTPYFNHAIYPDMMLRWHEAGVGRERPLFLRFEVAEGTVTQDLRLHGDRDPMLIGLLDHRPAIIDELAEDGDPDEAAPDDQQADEPPVGGALLAEASAIDLLEDLARERQGQAVATSAIARGGHGRLSAEGALELGESLDAGFQAAAQGRDPELVLDAYSQLEQLIAPVQAQQLATHLQLLWISAGGELADLFGESRIEVDTLSDTQLRELLEHLLTREEEPSVALLRRFAFALTPDRLGQLLRNFEGGHLGALVEANSGLWSAKWVQVLEGGPVGWRLDDELLRLGLGDRQLTFTSRGKKLARFSAGQAVPRTQFTQRLEQDRTWSLDLVSDEAEVALRRRPSADDDVQLRPEQIDALGELASQVLRGQLVTSTLRRARDGEDPGTEVQIDYARGLCAFEEEVTLSRAERFARRYFDLARPTTDSGATENEPIDAPGDDMAAD